MNRRNNDFHVEQIAKAFRNGGTRRKNTHIEIDFTGDATHVGTFENEWWHATGVMTFRHHGSRVLVADFDRDMVTDFGYSGYSMTTTRHICEWMIALQRMGWISLKSFDIGWPFDWTYNYTYNKKPRFRGAGYREDMYLRFRAKAPWVHWDRDGFA